MMRMQYHLALALLVAGVAAGCRGNERSPRTTTQYTDDIGRTVTVAVPAKRIVTLAPNLTEIVFAAGANDKLAGVTTADDYPPEIVSVPSFNAVPIDFEAITRLQPDIVLATDQVNSSKDAATFESLRIPVYFFHFGALDDVFRAIVVVGNLAGTGERAATHAETLRQALEDLRSRVSTVTDRPRVLFLINDEKLFGFGRGSYVHEIIRAAGGLSVSESEEIVAPVFSDEYVVTERPDVIIGSFPEKVDAISLLEQHPAWKTVPAIRDKRVYALNPDIILRPGPRVIEGAYRIALLIHPELFGNGSPVTSR